MPLVDADDDQPRMECDEEDDISVATSDGGFEGAKALAELRAKPRDWHGKVERNE